MNGKIHSFLSILCLGILLCALGAFLVEILLCYFSGQLTFSMVRYLFLQGIFAIIAIWYPYSFFVFLAAFAGCSLLLWSKRSCTLAFSLRPLALPAPFTCFSICLWAGHEKRCPWFFSSLQSMLCQPAF